MVMFNALSIIGFFVFNLTLLSYLLLLTSSILWLAARVKAVAGFDPAVAVNPFGPMLHKAIMVCISLSIVSVLLGVYFLVFN